MPTLRFLRARTAARLAVTVVVGVSAAPVGSLTESVADARERAHAPAARAATPSLPEAGAPALTHVQEGAEGAAGTVAGQHAKASHGRSPRAADERGRRHHASEATEVFSPLPPQGKGHDNAGEGTTVVRMRHGGRRGAHGGPGLRGKGSTQAGESAAQPAGKAVDQAGGELTAASGVAGRKHRGGRGGRGGHGKHRGSSGEAGGGSSPGSSGGATPGSGATAGSSRGAKQSPPAAASRVAPATAPVSSPSPRAVVAPLAPQLAAVANQPSSRARRTGTAAAGRTRGGAFEVALPTATVGAASEGPAAAATPTATRPAAARARDVTHQSNNLPDRIGRQIPLPLPVPDSIKPVIVALFMLAIWLAIRASLAGARARRLERQGAALLRDMGAMQAALVPEVPRELGGLAVSVAYRPAEGPAAGGDFYDLVMPRPGIVAVMLGDVSGHGHEALTHAALTRYTLRAYLQAGLEPRTALALAGRVLKDPTGERYSTVALAVYDASEGTLTYALAGHPPPMLLGPDAPEPITACSSPPVGWGLPTGRRQTTISLPQGAEVCFFSDGLIEARREGQLLGREHLREILAGLGPQPVAEELLEEVRAATQGTPDDMVACVLSPKESPAREHVHIEELEVDASALARVGVRRFLRECKVAPAAMARALRLATETASTAGSAVIRVTFGAERRTVTVSAPGSPGVSGTRAARIVDVPPTAPDLVAGATQARALA
jgi:Stage II sporulation protein E (SpoIIE)